jgi:hypothetical protein
MNMEKELYGRPVMIHLTFGDLLRQDADAQPGRGHGQSGHPQYPAGQELTRPTPERERARIFRSPFPSR